MQFSLKAPVQHIQGTKGKQALEMMKSGAGFKYLRTVSVTGGKHLLSEELPGTCLSTLSACLLCVTAAGFFN